jgi:hypothetical protein
MSIGSGRYISRTGKYRWFPLAGTILVTIGLILLSRLGAHTSLVIVGLDVLVFGAGLGLFIQVLTLVVQNAVPMREMGVATSSVTFFRSMGGAIGASALGAVLTARIAAEFRVFLPPAVLAGGGDKVAQLVQSPSVVDALKRTNPALHEGIIQAYSHGIDRLFLVAIPVSVLSVIAALFIRQVNLRGSAPTPPSAPAEGGGAANGARMAGNSGAVNGATAADGATGPVTGAPDGTAAPGITPRRP